MTDRDWVSKVPRSGHWTEVARSTDGEHVYITPTPRREEPLRYMFVRAEDWDAR